MTAIEKFACRRCLEGMACDFCCSTVWRDSQRNTHLASGRCVAGRTRHGWFEKQHELLPILTLHVELLCVFHETPALHRLETTASHLCVSGLLARSIHHDGELAVWRRLAVQAPAAAAADAAARLPHLADEPRHLLEVTRPGFTLDLLAWSGMPKKLKRLRVPLKPT